jgi:hypothetical protein
MKTRAIVFISILLFSINLYSQEDYFEYDFVELRKGFKETLELYLSSIKKYESRNVIHVYPHQLSDGRFEIYIRKSRASITGMSYHENAGGVLAIYEDYFVCLDSSLSALYSNSMEKIKLDKSNFFDDTSDDFIPLTENFPTWIIQMSNYRIIELDTQFNETSEELEKELFKISFKE